MANDLVKQLDERFFQVLRGSTADSQNYLYECFNLTDGLEETELFSGENISTIEYLFGIAALSISSKVNNGLVHPVISIPSVGSKAVFKLLTDRLDHYAKQEPSVKHTAIDCRTLVGRSVLKEEGIKAIEIPNLIKWRMENEESCLETKIFLLYNADAIVSSGTITLKEVISELSSISESASFIVFLRPSSYYYTNATWGNCELSSAFSRLKTLEGFDASDIHHFRTAVENRIKKVDGLKDLILDDLGLEIALAYSRGIPAYAFKIIQEGIKSALIAGSNEITDTSAIRIKNELKLDGLWKAIDALTPGQLDILTLLMTFPENRASVYSLKERLALFRGFAGDRSAILQQIRKLYDNEILDRDRPAGSKQVYYKIRKFTLPALEYRLKQVLQSVK